MFTKILVAAALLVTAISITLPAFSQNMFDEQGGYNFSYDAFCTSNEGKAKNAYALMKGGQISPKSFSDARLNSLTECPKTIHGLPIYTREAVEIIDDPRRVFVVPGQLHYIDRYATATNQFMELDYTKLSWYAKRKTPINLVAAEIKAGADVNWRNSLQFPISYYAIQRGDAALLKALLKAGADPNAEIPRGNWHEKLDDVIWPEFLWPPPAPGQYSRTNLKDGYHGPALLDAYREKGMTHSILDYASTLCTEFRSPQCWEIVHALLDAGAKPKYAFFHNFFRPHRFNIFPKWPEYQTGVTRLISAGAGLNAPDQQGRTVLAKLLEMHVAPETLDYLMGLGAKTDAESPPATRVIAPSEQKPTAQTLPAPRASATAEQPSGSRIATAGINVRQKPSIDAGLIGTLGANMVFNIEETSADGLWSRIDAPPIIRGWANNAVISKSSTPNTSSQATR